MAGIDHSRASIKYREQFSFTKDELDEAMKTAADISGVSGCIIISTCNRTELWLSADDSACCDPAEIICSLKNVQYEKFRGYFIQREDRQAIEHLMTTACGINSRVFGEDQIITQIKDALDSARKAHTTGRILEKVFQNSITAAKKIKSSVKLTSHRTSVADSGIKKLKDLCGDIYGLKCLIIGNGMMAALIAEDLVKNGASVSMTLRRKYHHGEEFSSIVPDGCSMLPYESRYDAMGSADVIISATLSPHYTVTAEGLEKIKLKDKVLFMDLAVPRDIEPEISSRYNIKIYDVDDLAGEDLSSYESEINSAKDIMSTYCDDTINWLSFRNQVPKVEETVSRARKDSILRADKEIKRLGLNEVQVSKVEEIMAEASGKAVSKLLFGLRQTLSPEYWEVCIDAVLEAARKDTMKS